MIKIAIDAMGGDFGAEPIVKGVCEALRERDFHAILVGDEAVVKSFVPSELLSRVSFVQSSDVFGMDELATDVLKQKESTIFKVVELVRNNEAIAAVSAGHSGATMSLATLRIGRLRGVSRPPLATLMPTCTGKKTLVLDVGANTDCTADYLFEFAVMGEAYAKEVLGVKEPKVALLSNGEEDCKGNKTTKRAFELCKKLSNFVGNAEGNQIFDGSVDVIVCDGFVGNILLKTSEGIASVIGKIIKTEISNSVFAKIGALFMKGVFRAMKKEMDYDEYGGAPLLGVKNCVIISHGKSSPKAIKNAIFQAIKFSNSKINNEIESRLVEFNG